MKRMYGGAVLLAVALAAAGCGSDEGASSDSGGSAGTTGETSGGTATSGSEPLVIGYAASLTGEGAIGDVPGKQGMDYAVDNINATGGCAGHPVELIVKDEKTDPAVAGTVARELLDAGASVIIGPPFSSDGAPVVQAAAEADVAVIPMTATGPEWIDLGSNVFLAAFGDNVQAAAAAEHALADGHKTALLLVSSDTNYTSTTPEWFGEAFTNGGGEVIGEQAYSILKDDYSAEVTRIANLSPQPDVIYSALFMPDLGVMTKQLRDAGVTSTLYGADAFDTQEFVDFVGSGADGTVFTTHSFPEAGNAAGAFIEGVTEFQGSAPEAPALTSLAGDTIAIICAAVEAAGSTERAAILAALPELEGVQGVTGEITYKGTNHIPEKEITLVAIENGEFVFKEARVPEFVPEP